MAPPNGTEAVALPVLPAYEERYWVSTLKRLARRRIALFGLAVVVIVVFAATCAPWLTPFDPLEQDINQRLKEPGWRNADGQVHPLGTDHLGRDILARVIFGSRIALVVGLSAVLISGVLGMIIGLVAGYFGGKVDDFFMRLADIQLALQAGNLLLLRFQLALDLVAFLALGIGVFFLCCVLIIFALVRSG